MDGAVAPLPVSLMPGVDGLTPSYNLLMSEARRKMFLPLPSSPAMADEDI